jgi:hypothetical protein
MCACLSIHCSVIQTFVKGTRVRHGISSIFGLSRRILFSITTLYVCHIHSADMDTATCATPTLGNGHLSVLARSPH